MTGQPSAEKPGRPEPSGTSVPAGQSVTSGQSVTAAQSVTAGASVTRQPALRGAMGTRPRRDRRGRGVRGPLAWPPVPAMQTRADLFDDLVLEAAARFENRIGTGFGEIEFAVEDVPPSDPSAWEAQDIALGRLFPADGSMPPRIVVYRRPVETRTQDRRELAALVSDVIVEQIAALLSVDPRELDPGYEPDDDD